MKYWFESGFSEMETSKKKPEFRKTKTGLNIAYCKKCNEKHFPDEWQLKQGSSCCHVEYVPEPINQAV